MPPRPATPRMRCPANSSPSCSAGTEPLYMKVRRRRATPGIRRGGYPRAVDARFERHSHGRVGGGGARRGGAARAPAPWPHAARRHRRCGHGAVCAGRRDPALARSRRRGGVSADERLRGQLRDAARRPRAPGGARAGALSDRRRSRPRPGRAARAAAAARLRAARGRAAVGRRAGARVVPLAVVRRAARDRRLPAAASARAVRERRAPDVRGVRPRTDRLLGGPDGAAVVRRAGRRAGNVEAVRAAHDARARRGILEGRVDAALRCSGRESARRHALAALRDIGDGRAPARRRRPATGRAGVDVRARARPRARVPRRALRDRSPRRAGARRGRAPPRATGGPRAARGLAHGPAARGTGARMSPAPVDVPNPRSAEDADDEEMPRVVITRRRALLFGLFVLVAIAFLYYGLPKLAGLSKTWKRLG